MTPLLHDASRTKIKQDQDDTKHANRKMQICECFYKSNRCSRVTAKKYRDCYIAVMIELCCWTQLVLTLIHFILLVQSQL